LFVQLDKQVALEIKIESSSARDNGNETSYSEGREEKKGGRREAEKKN
jgi:hypothetical protein